MSKWLVQMTCLFLLVNHLLAIEQERQLIGMKENLISRLEMIEMNMINKEESSNWNKSFLKDTVHSMFQFTYDNYMLNAFPLDELNPIDCKGRGVDYDDETNININDSLGDFMLTLVDAMDMLVIMNNRSEFLNAISIVIDYLHFDKENLIQVFESNIRIIGGLLSAHLIIVDEGKPFGDFTFRHESQSYESIVYHRHMKPEEFLKKWKTRQIGSERKWIAYDNELLELAKELADRLLVAFDNSTFALPQPRVHLREKKAIGSQSNVAAVGSLIVEFGLLTKLTGDSRYYEKAKNCALVLWSLKSKRTGLLGNTLNIPLEANTLPTWINPMSGIGAGIDSFFEYLIKASILFGDNHFLKMFNDLYKSMKRLLKTENDDGFIFFANHNMFDGKLSNYWIDSLQASFPALLILNGEIDEAKTLYDFHYYIWKKYHMFPERFDVMAGEANVKFYPLRPEFVESTYYLYLSTNNEFYMKIATEIVRDLLKFTLATCGFATVHDVNIKNHEDRTESFFLSETLKYLYLIFDTNSVVNKKSFQLKSIFNTEGHLLLINREFQGGNIRRNLSNMVVVQDEQLTDNLLLHSLIRQHGYPYANSYYVEDYIELIENELDRIEQNPLKNVCKKFLNSPFQKKNYNQSTN
ncbi:hypothetical protein SNEBB_008846 [Seison nebaliae]|nr:hypothetical protein SNEBB_008846 [Seison nebaliae]